MQKKSEFDIALFKLYARKDRLQKALQKTEKQIHELINGAHSDPEDYRRRAAKTRVTMALKKQQRYEED